MHPEGIDATRRDVDALVATFPPEHRDRVRSALPLLDGDRVRVAVLRLAERDVHRFEHVTIQALLDPHDVLAWAFYPDEMRDTPGGDAH